MLDESMFQIVFGNNGHVVLRVEKGQGSSILGCDAKFKRKR